MNAGRCGTFSFIAFRLFIALTVLSICSVKAAEWDSEGAQQAFLKAEELSKGLDKHPEAPVDEYLRCARTYRKVYFKDPHYAQSGNAIYLEGILYQKMGGIFGEPDYYRLAIKRFKFLVSDYGGNEHCRDSLKRIGDIYSENMGDMAAAASAYDLLEKRYPLSGPKSTSSNTIKAEAPVRPENQDATVNKPPVKRRSVVQDIRHWASNDYTRLIIDLDSDAHWKKNLIRNPDRMYFDIDGASLSEKLHGKVFAIQDKFLKQVRVGQFNPDTVRIVLDFSSFSTYSI
ncbi:MAG: AMIN domain-containing protein, partial [Acidobacteriota bacterium]